MAKKIHFDKPRLKKNPILVYIIDTKSSGSNFYDEVIFDFRKSDDQNSFLKYLKLQKTDKTLISIMNYQSPKRIIRGCYYQLNVDLLLENGVQRKSDIDEGIIAHRFIFNQVPTDGEKKPRLFDEHEPLDNYEIFVPRSNYNIEFYDLQTDPIFLRVNNVGQGNSNEIISGDRVIYVFDVGYNMRASQGEIRTFIDSRIKDYQTSKPALIISHWDLDHIIQLSFMTDQELGSFSAVFCNNRTHSLTSKNLYNRLKAQIPSSKINVFISRDRSNQSYPLMYKIASNNTFALYLGEKSRNINYSGLVFSVKGSQTIGLLTGDCALVQASDVLSYETQNIAGNHCLVVPHHGGDYSYQPLVYRTYKIPKGVVGTKAIISVDANGNGYGHPSQIIMRFLRPKFGGIIRTDKNGTIIEQL